MLIKFSLYSTQFSNPMKRIQANEKHTKKYRKFYMSLWRKQCRTHRNCCYFFLILLFSASVDNTNLVDFWIALTACNNYMYIKRPLANFPKIILFLFYLNDDSYWFRLWYFFLNFIFSQKIILLFLLQMYLICIALLMHIKYC